MSAMPAAMLAVSAALQGFACFLIFYHTPYHKPYDTRQAHAHNPCTHALSLLSDFTQSSLLIHLSLNKNYFAPTKLFIFTFNVLPSLYGLTSR